VITTTTTIGRHFQRIQPKWGTPECPYDTLAFERLHEEFTRGGAVELFRYIERAAANYIGAAMRDEAYRSVTVVFQSRFLARQFQMHLRRVLRNMGLEGDIAAANDERLTLRGNRRVDTEVLNERSVPMRGTSSEFIMLVGVELDASEWTRTFVRETLQPHVVVGGDVAHLVHEYDDDYDARVAAANLAASTGKIPSYANIILRDLKRDWGEAAAGAAAGAGVPAAVET
jgi:hypothetical protein